MMILRDFWLDRIRRAWEKRSIIWFPGVRRTGKTSICRSIEACEYFDCELPRIRKMMADPEAFLQNLTNKKIALDEIHRLENPSELLKIAADHYSNIKIIATGSSTLSASKKFKDTLTGRKTNLWLSPMLFHEQELFGQSQFEHRLLHGGLPPFFMQEELPEIEFTEWLDDYWAKDIQELFNISNKYSFQRFTELLLANSGNIFEATKFAASCEVSRTTINKYLHVLAQTYVAHIIRPYTSYAANEIISAPKVYGFDTGFVCHYRGWTQLRPEDFGYLLEHIVLNEILTRFPTAKVQYWRDKSKHEIDFIYTQHKTDLPVAIECKWSSTNFNSKNFHRFRKRYPKGKNIVISIDITKPYFTMSDNLKIDFVGLQDLVTAIST